MVNSNIIKGIVKAHVESETNFKLVDEIPVLTSKTTRNNYATISVRRVGIRDYTTTTTIDDYKVVIKIKVDRLTNTNTTLSRDNLNSYEEIYKAFRGQKKDELYKLIERALSIDITITDVDRTVEVSTQKDITITLNIAVLNCDIGG